ncbi:MAG: PAS domain-containing protein [Caldilineae bacterium]|nr:MAG: PAS domain-containing protein [Caldilineae bacterium]
MVFDPRLTGIITQIARSPFPWVERLEKVAEVVLQMSGFDAVSLATVAPFTPGAAGVFRPQPQHRPYDVVSVTENVPFPARVTSAPSLSRQVLESGQPVFAPSPGECLSEKTHCVATLFQFSKICVQAVLPLATQEGCAGVMVVGAHTNRAAPPPPPLDRDGLMQLAQHIALALENAHLQEESRRVQMFASLIAAANQGADFRQTTQAVIATLRDLLPFQMAVIGLVDESQSTLQNFFLNASGKLLETMPPVAVEASVVNVLANESTPYTRFDLSLPPLCPHHARLAGYGFQSALSFRLQSQQQTIGHLSLASASPHTFADRSLDWLAPLLPALSIVLQKAYFQDALERRATELKDLILLNDRFLSRPEPDAIIDTFLTHVPRLVPAEIHGILLSLSDEVKMGLNLPSNAGDALRQQVQKAMWETLESSHPARRPPPSPADVQIRRHATFLPPDWEIKSTLAWPILSMQGVLGVVYAAYGEEFSVPSTLLRLYSLVVSSLAAALENSQLLSKVTAERAMLVSVLNSTPDGILVVNREGRILLDNPAARRALGYTPNRQQVSLTDITDNQDLLALFEAARQRDSVTEEITTANKQTFYTSIRPVHVPEEEAVIGWIVVLQNVTHFKELNEAKDHFVNIVSHDLRSPLTNIYIATQLLKTLGPLEDSQEELTTIIEKYVRQMTNLIDDLLDLSKIEANIEPEMEANNLNEMVREVVEELRPQAEKKSITLQTDLPDTSYRVRCNLNRLRQVTVNLIENAIKYTPPDGQVMVQLSVQDNSLLCRVTDTGIGIPKKALPHIFEKFYRVKQAEGAQKGSGLGLSICKTIIEQHRGRIWAESQLNKGSTFSFVLPLCEN